MTGTSGYRFEYDLHLIKIPSHLDRESIYNFTTNTLKAYLSTQASSLRAFVISKTHISGQKPRGRQLNKKVCGSKSAIFVILSFFVQTTLSNNDNSKTVQALTLILARNGCSSQRTASKPLSIFIASNSPWSMKAIHNTLWLLFVVKDAIFQFCTHAHTKSRSQAKYHVHWSGNDT